MSSNYEAATEIREAIYHLADAVTEPYDARQQVLDFSGGAPRIIAEQINTWLSKNPGWYIQSIVYQCHPSDVAYAKGAMHYALVVAESISGGVNPGNSSI